MQNDKYKTQLSYDRIDKAKCLYRYKKIRIDKDVKVDTIQMKIGKAIHQIVHEYTKECVKQAIETDYEIMNQTIEKVFDDNGLPDECYTDIREVCLLFGESSLDYDHTLEWEKYFSIPLGNDSKGKLIEVGGYIDRVNTRYWEDGACLEIIDYKTQRNIETQEQIASDPQLQLYRYIALKHLYQGFRWCRMGKYYLRYNFIRWDAESPIYVGDLRNNLDSINGWLKRQWERVFNSTNHPPDRGQHCWEYSGCPVMLENKCPLWDMKEVEKFRKAKDIKNKVRLLRKLDLERKLELKMLKTIIGERSIDVDGQQVGYEQHEVLKMALDKFTELELPTKGIKISNRDVNKAIEIGQEKHTIDEALLNRITESMETTINKKFVY